MKHQPAEYRAIKEWHVLTGTTDPRYWQRLQERAAEQGQPLDVIFEEHESPGAWRRVCNLHKEHSFRVRHPEFVGLE